MQRRDFLKTVLLALPTIPFLKFQKDDHYKTIIVKNRMTVRDAIEQAETGDIIWIMNDEAYIQEYKWQSIKPKKNG